jgi:DEAD/DEAH box helicase domain-containing protein
MLLSEANVTVFDLEIKNEIKGAIGWKDYDKMGISVGCSYNFKSDNYKLYFDDNLDELIQDLNASDMITGFNIKGFDLPLLAKCPEVTLKLRPDLLIYDVLEYSRESCGGSPYTKGLKLDNHLEGTFGLAGMKNGHGANAPLLWQNKKLGELCTYVLRDVNREKALFAHCWEHGHVVTPAHGKKTVTNPKNVLEVGF